MRKSRPKGKKSRSSKAYNKSNPGGSQCPRVSCKSLQSSSSKSEGDGAAKSTWKKLEGCYLLSTRKATLRLESES
ncbi:hypothetical protein V6N13_043124 [Hibiscus sabdariffa]|uniref:Uncharacterized protein n=1 Tax=Hibiscus sabdariffa TaxID=183260 RepID=A0ABR2G2L3_9ROSI